MTSSHGTRWRKMSDTCARASSVHAMLLWLALLALFNSGCCVPDTCSSTLDAVAQIRGELFFFKDHYFWRVSRHGHLMTRQPVKVSNFWQGLDQRSPITAVYERRDGSVVFFSGRHYWVFWERSAMPGYPRPLSELGLPEEAMAVDAAFLSAHNAATYLIIGDKYWRFSEKTGRVEADSPLPISRLCRGLPSRLDAAFTDAKGRSYFIQGRYYWQCDASRGVVRSYTPDLTSPRWFGCTMAQCCLAELRDAVQTQEWPNGKVGQLKGGSGARGVESLLTRVLVMIIGVVMVMV